MIDMQFFPQRIKERRPLIHNMTNIVVANFTANGLLAIGASPVMASAKEEVADMAKAADALVLNLGTLDTDMIEAMLIAGRSANVHGIPVILDPVGAGATPYRTKVSVKMLKELRVSIVRGNAAEIAQLMGEAGEIKGVDCMESESSLRSPESCSILLHGQLTVSAPSLPFRAKRMSLQTAQPATLLRAVIRY